MRSRILATRLAEFLLDDRSNALLPSMDSGKTKYGKSAEEEEPLIVYKRFLLLSLVVMGEWEDLVNARAALVQRMNTLSSPITPNDVYISGNCRICRAHLKKTGERM